ncbi:MAG: metallophosphoesterase [Terracidiphilus sp.]|jgi:sphingomyelin phosphodiesterase acid-like 3
MNFFAPAKLPRGAANPRVLLLCALLCATAGNSQSAQPAAKRAASNASLPVLLLSDIHFEPFWDPDRVAQLDGAPVAKWNAILASPPSIGRQRSFDALQQSCNANGTDTSFTLYQSALREMRNDAAGASFIAVSGDLIAHKFHCKYFTLFQKATNAQYQAFVEKTLEYVIGELKASFPKTPTYTALGNNDSACEDYLLDAGSSFLKETGSIVTRDFPAIERQDAEQSFTDGGYYSVFLPAPIQNARLLVLDDLFMSRSYRTCAGVLDPTAADPQVAWLGRQLALARAGKQKVWVMGHIPPGVDLYSTAKRSSGICGTQKPVMFLSSEKMADVMAAYGDVIELAIFAHTHMDELRLLQGSNPTTPPVAVKMVSSISPVHQNLPSFTLARIDPSSAALIDYRVFSSPNLTGGNAKWKPEYDFATSFSKSDFSASSLSALISAFAADPGANTKASQNYIGDFSAGNSSTVLQLFWPQYVCALSNHTQQAFTACACGNHP